MLASTVFMRRRAAWLVALLLVVCVALSTGADEDTSSSSDNDDTLLTDDLDDSDFDYFEDFCESGASTSRPHGRPAEHYVLESDFAESCEVGMTETELMAEHDLSLGQVRRLKAKWNLQGVAEVARSRMPACAELHRIWESDTSMTVAQLACHCGVSESGLRKYFKRIGYEPPRANPDDGAVIDALRQLRSNGWCADLGCTFAAARLRLVFSLVVGGRQLRRCLAALDPQEARRRHHETASTRYRYNVAGPRSLYHCDAHEKLAKIWGFWFHLCIDGYSRFILYLTVLPNKLAAAVGELFVEACDVHAPWASRVRWDRGKENVRAMEAQYMYWWDDSLSDHDNLKRGSVLSGRSVQNCRAEYIWRYVKKQVTNFFRKTFMRLAMEYKLLDAGNVEHLFCLHAVYLPLIQRALDDFREMWNHHRIRGGRTIQGYGGGVPAQLFNDPVGSAAVRQRMESDDTQFASEGDQFYGVDEPFAPDKHELESVQARTQDPLRGWPSLQYLRTQYFVQHPFESTDGVRDYIEYLLLCEELLAWVVHQDSGRGGWQTFAAAAPVGQMKDVRAGIRRRLALLAQQL